MKFKKIYFALILSNLLFFSLYGKKTEFTSTFLNSKVEIDGNSQDWEKLDATLWNDKIYISFQHDNTYLYGLIITEDEKTKRKMLMSGTTLWFNTKGKTKKDIGIHYPLGFLPDKTNNIPNRQKMLKLNDEEKLSKFLENISNEAEIFSNKNKVQKKNISEVPGLEIKIKESDGLLIYEFKVPCVEKSPFLFSVYPEKTNKIGFGLTIGRDLSTKRPSMQGDKSMRPSRGNRPQGMSGGRSQGRENKRGNFRKDMQPIKLWGIIDLKK